MIRNRNQSSAVSKVSEMCPDVEKRAPRALFRPHNLLAIAAVLATMVLFQYQSSQCRTQIAVASIQHANHNIDVSVIEELYQTVTAERLSKIAKQYKSQYAQASPFPHIAIDHIFPERFLQAVLKEMPESDVLNGCVSTSTACFQHRSSTQQKKSAVDVEEHMGFLTRILFGFMKSSTFIHFLEELTAIEDIIPDPHYRGSGLHFTAPGGNLDVHADFNKYQAYQLDRRVNAFIYLNPNWKDEYGGHLELWSKDMTSCYQRILPTMGRFVVFSSTDFSYHGHPEALLAPADRARRSMALYYYTNGRPSEECLNGDCSGKGHSTLFKKPVGCQVCQENTCKAYDENKPNWVEAFQ